MSNAEARRFAAWTTHAFTTTAHSDVSFYAPYGSPALSPCDFFLKSDGSFGYNTNLNRGYGLDPSTPYSFAHGMDDVIRPETVLDRFTHAMPVYTVEAVRHRDEIRETNGENHTFHAGAYLGGGLHEGAVASALAVSQALGGRDLPPSPHAGGL
ncbi:amine oxidase, flavin-containing [Minicystis rosea]|nr:amine oxidase, flavin-containing [Minicystis rosea]